MALVLIVILTIANAITAVYCLKHYANRASLLQLCFVIVWTMQYVIGNALVFISRDLTYSLSSFGKFEWNYIVSLLVGQYFLWAFLFLLDLNKKRTANYLPLRRDGWPIVLLVLGASAGFALWFIVTIGVEQYYSQQLAEYRARLGEYSFEGIGVFYYLAGFLLPATILVGAYATAYFNSRTAPVFLGALVLALVVFVPLGGRGRIINIIIVLVLHYLILRGQFRLTKLLNWRIVAVFSVLMAASYIWGVFREHADARLSGDLLRVAYSLSVDTTRLPTQAFIFDTYPLGGFYYGMHYVEGLLGPFYEALGAEPNGLISDVSARWYYEAFFGYNIRSAISPSYIDEAYMTFGVIGVILAPVFFFLLVRLTLWIGHAQSALANAAVIYFVEFNLFHGGLYALFDMLLVVLPILIFSRFFSGRLPARPDRSGQAELEVAPARS